jgi:hypothetical protein
MSGKSLCKKQKAKNWNKKKFFHSEKRDTKFDKKSAKGNILVTKVRSKKYFPMN